jgi:hypothetical protein
VSTGQSYQAGGVKVTIRRIALANVHQPGEAAGLIFRADALGFQWGKSPATATLRVDRKWR